MPSPAPLDPLALAQALIRCPSVTPEDAGALEVLCAALEPLGFVCHRVRFEEEGTAPVDNLYARWGTTGRNFCFAGHTDVVPPGDRSAWSVDPFAGEVCGDRLFGRGAVDMKGAIAAFAAAAARHLAGRATANQTDQESANGSISLLITGDEEGISINGTRKLLGWLAERGERLDDCLVGEPTNPHRLGESVKIGRRGSLYATLTAYGAQGHTAYPHLADNPLPRLARLLDRLASTPLDTGTPHFQPSTLALTSVDVGNPTGNIIPAQATARFNIRFNDQHTPASLKAWVWEQCAAVGGAYGLDMMVSGEAFLTPPGRLSTLVQAAAAAVTGRTPELGTGGGTSDARFIKNLCPVVEFGLVGESMHKVDENVRVQDLHDLTSIYTRVLDAYHAC